VSIDSKFQGAVTRQRRANYSGWGQRIGAKPVLKNLILISGFFSINAAGPPGNILFFLGLLYLGSRGAEGTVKALSLLYLALTANKALVSTANIFFTIGKFGILFASVAWLFISISRQKKSFMHLPMINALAAFCIAAFCLAILADRFILISAFKLISFSVGALCIFLAIEALRDRRHNLDIWFLSIAIFIALAGMASYALGIGFNAKTDDPFSDGLFNGSFYHPQTLGPAAALILLWLLGFCLLSSYNRKWIAFVLIPVLLGFAYLSSSRTSLAAVGMAAIFVTLTAAVSSNQIRKQIGRGAALLFLPTCLLMSAVVAIEFVQPGRLSAGVVQFIMKRGQGDGQALRVEQISSSRQPLIDMMLANISERPWVGIGFGTSTRPGFGSGDSIFESTTTEKGILPIAVVEETGIIGATFFAAFLFSVFRYLLRKKNLIGFAGVAALLGINMGEMNFFAFGGQGGLFWIWVLALVILGASAHRKGRNNRFQVTRPDEFS